MSLTLRIGITPSRPGLFKMRPGRFLGCIGWQPSLDLKRFPLTAAAGSRTEPVRAHRHRAARNLVRDREQITVGTTGPLFADDLEERLRGFTGYDDCHFIDADSPLVQG
jgi:hypothetical protein